MLQLHAYSDVSANTTVVCSNCPSWLSSFKLTLELAA